MQDTVDLIGQGPNTERRWFEFTPDSGSQEPENPMHQNLANPLDVNNDGHFSPLDALLVISSLDRYEGGVLPEPEDNLTQFVDVDGDGFVSPFDALLVINNLPSEPSSTAVTTVFRTNPFVAEDEEEQQHDQPLSWH